MHAMHEIQFQFIERRHVYSSLIMYIPRKLQQQIKLNAILAVAIVNLDTQQDYIGTGVVKNMEIYRGNPLMRVRLQIDIQYPLDKSKRQAMPDP